MTYFKFTSIEPIAAADSFAGFAPPNMGEEC